jgi:hypothetical protein
MSRRATRHLAPIRITAELAAETKSLGVYRALAVRHGVKADPVLPKATPFAHDSFCLPNTALSCKRGRRSTARLSASTLCSAAPPRMATPLPAARPRMNQLQRQTQEARA